MYLKDSRWGIPGFLGLSTLGAVYILFSPGIFDDWILDPLTACVAVVSILAACSQLASAAYDRGASRLWHAIITVLVLICVAQFFDVISGRLGTLFGTDDCDDFLILLIAPCMLSLASRQAPAFSRAKAAVWAGLIIQSVATVLDLLFPEASLDPSGPVSWSVLSDFADFTAISLYLIAIFCLVIDTGRAIGVLPVPEELPGAQYTQHGGSIRDRSYPPPFILGLNLPAADTPAGRIHRLCNRAMWPAGDIFASARNLWLIASWPFVAALRAGVEVSEQGALVEQATGKTRLAQFREQVALALWHRITPRYYYLYELYLRDQQRQAAHYLSRWETKEIAYRLLYPVATESYEPAPLRDKAAFAGHCDRHGLRHVPVLATYEYGTCSAGTTDLPAESLFFKPAQGKGGSGAERWLFLGEGRYRNTKGLVQDKAELLAHLQRLSLKQGYLVQPVCQNHPRLQEVSAGALATVRILTLRRNLRDFEVTNAAFRMPVSPSSAVDNFHAGGIAAAVDVESGRLGMATNLSFRGPARWWQKHPHTGNQIEGLHLPFWQETKDLVTAAHRAFGDYVVIGWDVAILETGPVLVEGNRGPDVDIIQRTERGPIGTTRFGELLARNLELRVARPADRSRPAERPRAV